MGGGGKEGGGLVGYVQSRDVYPFGKLQLHFIFGFHFRHSLCPAFATAFSVLRGLLIVLVGTIGSF